MASLDGLRSPEHTGEERCWRCTLVNLVLASAASTLAYVGGSTFVSSSWGVASAAAVLAVGAAAIWLRGYLFPYTPALTRRYLPSPVLTWFGKQEGEVDGDVERALVEAGAVRRAPSSTEIEVDPGFEERWLEQIDSVERDVDHAVVAEAMGFDVEEEEIRTFEGRGEAGDAFAVEVVDRGATLAKWPSRTALQVDLASARMLSDSVDGWSEEPPEWRARVVRGLRLFLPRCPDGGEVVRGSEEVPSCCSRGRVITLVCGDSGERLLEQRVRPGSY